MSKRRRRSRSGSGKHKARPTAPPVAHFTAAEEEFFRTGDSLHEVPAAAFEDLEAERPSLWRRLFSRAA
jgi:hypothetical protein